MKRDMDLIREILLHIESDSQYDGTRWVTPGAPSELVESDRTMDELNYHLELLIEAGFLTGESHLGQGSPMINKLTWKGHEFLDDVRDNEIWGKTKERFKGLPSVAINIVAELAKAEIKKKLGLT
jgi:hypothetical protein